MENTFFNPGDNDEFNTQRLDAEETILMQELEGLQSEMDKLNPEVVHKEMLQALKNEAINSIATALDISDLMEQRPDNNSIYHTDISILKTNKEGLEERKRNYVRSNITGSEFMQGVSRIETNAKLPDGTAVHVDCYTGEKLIVGSGDNKYDHEHVISAKELSESYFTGLFLNEEEIRLFANSPENLKVTRAGINRSKGDMDLKEWMNKEHPGCPGKTNAEYYNIDEKIANKTFDEAHAELRKQIAIKAGERVTSMAKKTAVNVGGYALKQTIGELLKITITELIEEFKEKCLDPLTERFKRIMKRILSKSKRLLKTFKESALNNFVATIIDAVMNVFIDTTKKMFKIVRMLFKPILKAIKTLISPSSEVTFTERLLAASKIIGAALVGVLGVFLDEVINTAICTLPIPGAALVAPYVSPIISALIVGMISAMIIQGYDAYKKSRQLIEYKNREGHILYELEIIGCQRNIINGYNSRILLSQTHTFFTGVLDLYKVCEKEINERKQEIEGIMKNTTEVLADAEATNEEIRKMLNLFN